MPKLIGDKTSLIRISVRGGSGKCKSSRIHEGRKEMQEIRCLQTVVRDGGAKFREGHLRFALSALQMRKYLWSKMPTAPEGVISNKITEAIVKLCICQTSMTYPLDCRKRKMVSIFLLPSKTLSTFPLNQSGFQTFSLFNTRKILKGNKNHTIRNTSGNMCQTQQIARNKTI